MMRVQEIFPVVIATGFHLFPFRTEKLSPTAPMVLHTRGRVGRRHFTRQASRLERDSGLCFFKSHFSFEKRISPPKYLSQVLDQAKASLEAPATPHNYRNRVAELLPRLSLQFRGVSREKPGLFHSSATDLPIVKRIKEIANRIILQKHSQSYAWRIDVALFFERYVQWIFEQTAKRIGGEMFCNPKYAGHGANFDWLLHYLEPDIVLKFAETQIIVDAKYKSYLYHKYSKSDTLRESFRNDLHQLLAYTAFSTEKKKHCVLVAPFSSFEVSNIQYRSPFSDATIEIYCLGIPFSASSLSETIDQLCDWCQSLA